MNSINNNYASGIEDDSDKNMDMYMLRAGVEDAIIGAVKKLVPKVYNHEYYITFNIKPLIFFNRTTIHKEVHCYCKCLLNNMDSVKHTIHILTKQSPRYFNNLLIGANGTLYSNATMELSSLGPSAVSGNDMRKILQKGLFFDKDISSSKDNQLFYSDITHVFNVCIVPPIAENLVKNRQLTILDRVILRNFVNDVHNPHMSLTSFSLLYAYANNPLVYKWTHQHFSMKQIVKAYHRLLNKASILQISTVDIANSYAKPLLNKQARLRIY